MAIDSAIDNYYADQLRQEQTKSRKKGETLAEQQQQQQDRPRSLRLQMAMARKDKRLKEQLIGSAQEKVKPVVTSSMKQGTGSLLKLYWWNLISSFGLTLILINMHALLRWIFPSIFCKLGEEWIPKQASVINNETSQVPAFSKFYGLIEVMALISLDLLLLIIILAALGLTSMITDWVMSPEKLVTDFLKLNWSAISELAKLFW